MVYCEQSSEVDFTVVQQLNQGTIRQKGCNLLSVSFFGSFLDKQKRMKRIKNCNRILSTRPGAM
jgi:hypothetical protein